MSDEVRQEQRRSTTLSTRVFAVQQECARLDFTTRGADKTAKWVSGVLISALAEFEQVETEAALDP